MQFYINNLILLSSLKYCQIFRKELNHSCWNWAYLKGQLE